MKSLKFLIILSFIAYSLTISINQINHLEKYTQFEYDLSIPVLQSLIHQASKTQAIYI